MAILLHSMGLISLAQGVVAYQVLSALNALFEHANLSIGPRLDSALSWLWVTPSMHKVHHSADHAETDSSYGNIFAFYDRVFRTFTPTDRVLGSVRTFWRAARVGYGHSRWHRG
jgi:sterol desaturase/sphingolipid hydroxylase (fatty acid hydroxylase superfamily)